MKDEREERAVHIQERDRRIEEREIYDCPLHTVFGAKQKLEVSANRVIVEDRESAKERKKEMKESQKRITLMRLQLTLFENLSVLSLSQDAGQESDLLHRMR